MDAVLESGNASEPVDTRKGSYPDEIANSFGISVEEDRRQSEITEENGFVTMTMLTRAREDTDRLDLQEGKEQLSPPENTHALPYQT